MTPEKALELVGRYARLTKAIKTTKTQIGDSLDLCRGYSGKRNTVDGESKLDSKNRDLDLHLTEWYTPECGEYDNPSWLYVDDKCKEECKHCYSAHEAIQSRKKLVVQLGHVKRLMTRNAV